MYRKFTATLVLLAVSGLASACGGASKTHETPVRNRVEGEPTQPELIGGMRGLAERIRYPREAKRAGVEGVVVVKFVLDEEGNVTEPRVVQGLGYGCDAEALRVIRETEFLPALDADGVPFKLDMTLPIFFRLPNR